VLACLFSFRGRSGKEAAAIRGPRVMLRPRSGRLSACSISVSPRRSRAPASCFDLPAAASAPPEPHGRCYLDHVTMLSASGRVEAMKRRFTTDGKLRSAPSNSCCPGYMPRPKKRRANMKTTTRTMLVCLSAIGVNFPNVKAFPDGQYGSDA
jgi:hypothetical protein